MDVVSIHVAAAWLQATPFQLRRAASALGIDVECRVNNIDCFRQCDIERIAGHLALTRAHAVAIAPFHVPMM